MHDNDGRAFYAVCALCALVVIAVVRPHSVGQLLLAVPLALLVGGGAGLVVFAWMRSGRR